MAFELTAREKAQILQNSIERVINTSIQLAEKAVESQNGRLRELGDTNFQDWEELKTLVVKLWDRERDAIFRGAQVTVLATKDTR